MARRLLIVLVALAATLVWAGTARAAPENRDTFAATFDAAAGQLCDFAYHQEFTVNFSFKELPNGAYIEHDRLFVEHTNLETGYTLREQDRQNFIVNPSTATVKIVGVFWHLRDAAGKMVVVQAGQLTFDLNTGDLTKVTPNVDPDFAAVVCPALGGSPAS
jgi:hypothetical protein